jgi:hypothetical protein
VVWWGAKTTSVKNLNEKFLNGRVDTKMPAPSHALQKPAFPQKADPYAPKVHLIHTHKEGF